MRFNFSRTSDHSATGGGVALIGAATGPAPKIVSPEDDPFVREVVRRFDGRVTRVKEVSE